MTHDSVSDTSTLSTLNDDEVKRIILVLERDFKLREKEYKRINELKTLIRLENERTEYLSRSKEFNQEHCIRCHKSFKIIFNPKESCSECKLYVCHDCAIENKQTKLWSCTICLRLKELKSLTGDWFYVQSGKKYKRCGSAKVVRELHKREKDFTTTDDDFGYGTLPTSTSTNSKDSGSVISYVVHDKSIKKELHEYSKRLSLLIDNLQSELSQRNKNQENLKGHLQQIVLEIRRARIASSTPLRRSNVKPNQVYEKDLQNLLIQKTEEVLHTNLQQFQKNLTEQNSSTNPADFDQKLAQIILDKCINKKTSRDLSQVIDPPSIVPPVHLKPQRQSSDPITIKPSSHPLNRQHSTPRTSNPSSNQTRPLNTTLRKIDLPRTAAVDEEDTETEEQANTPTTSSIDDAKSDQTDNTRRFIGTDPETIKKSTERVDDWKTNFTITNPKVLPSDEDEEQEFTTWL